jgi:hypothetical protein
MTNPLTVLQKIRSAGGSVVSTGSDLEISVPQGILSAEDRQILAHAKQELVVLLAPGTGRKEERADPFDRSVVRTTLDKLAAQAPEGFKFDQCGEPWRWDDAVFRCDQAIVQRDQKALFDALLILEAEALDLFYRFEERRAIEQENEQTEASTEFLFTIGGSAKPKPKPEPEPDQTTTPRRKVDPQSVLSFAITQQEWTDHQRDMGR